MMGRQIDHWKCSACDKQLTRLEDGEIIHETHFDIARSNKFFDFNPEEGTFEEEMDERNEKMMHWLCEGCFLKILNESPTLGKLFYNAEQRCYIW